MALGHRFKLWAEHEFGGVKQMFSVLDADSSGQLSFREFKARGASYAGPATSGALSVVSF